VRVISWWNKLDNNDCASSINSSTVCVQAMWPNNNTKMCQQSQFSNCCILEQACTKQSKNVTNGEQKMIEESSAIQPGWLVGVNGAYNTIQVRSPL